jgi:hypothetical protein
VKLEDLKELYEAIGIIGSLLNSAALAATWFLGTVTTSPKFQMYIRTFAVLGGLAGLWFTFIYSAGKGKPACLKRGLIFLGGAVLSCAVGLFVISLTEGALVQSLPMLGSFRDFLLDNYVLANFAVGLAAGMTTYLLFGAFVLTYSKVWDLKLG